MKAYSVQGKKDTRSGFGDGLLEAAKADDRVVGMCADLIGSLKYNSFVKTFPERFFQAGIAEANMIGVAAGLATAGKIPFVGSFAAFATGRVYDQIRQSVAYSEKNVKICASHAGITLGEDGATHQIMEDIGLMKGLPNMVVINPADYNQTKAATIAAAKYVGPTYLRFGRPSEPIFTDISEPFIIGKGVKWNDGNDVTVIATGHMLWRAIQATEELISQGISVDLINIHTIKPLDSAMILESVSRTGAVVTCEEHFINGGLGDSVAQLLVRNNPVPQEYVAVDDKFGQSGTPSALMELYGLTPKCIIEKVHTVISRK